MRRFSEAPARPNQADALAVFGVMWALASLWHLLGNPTGAPWWSQAALVLGAGAVLLWPGSPLPLAALAGAGLVTAWGEAPVLGNHWLLAAFVDVAILGSIAAAALRRRLHQRTELAERLFPVARLCLLGFYAFAAFAKLNTAFFDRRVSCAPFYFQESTDSLGLGGLDLGRGAAVQHAVIWGTVLVELSVPLLLAVRRSRHLGVVVALVFHGVLALDRAHQFFDFSSLLAALFVLFLPPSAGSWLVERIGSVRARLALEHDQLPGRVHLGLAAIPVSVGLLAVFDVLSVSGARGVGWWPWQLYTAAVIGAVVVFLRQHRSAPAVGLRPHHLAFAIVPLLVVANGLTPYLELKTGFGWNMYSNLRTVDGESNHLLVRRTLPLTDEQAEVVRILSTSSPDLERYADSGYGLTWRQLRSYLARHPEVAITYQRGSETVSVRRAADRPELVEPVPRWREKLQLFRPVDLREPERCVPTFGPAR